MVNKEARKSQLKGDVFLLAGNQQSFASSQVELLKAISDCGSISKAAKQVGISYKTAWDRVDAMNNMSSQPLVSRSTGGAKGGGTALTELGQRVIDGFEALQQEHQRFIARVGDKLHSVNDLANFIKGESVKASSRNQFLGKVKKINPGKVSAEVIINIGVGQSIVSMITLESVKNLKLKKHDDVIVLVKAPSVMIATDLNIKTSARNKMTGVISRIVKGAVNSEVVLSLGEGKAICSIITDASVDSLGLEVGQMVCAIFTAQSVTLLKDR